MKTKMATIEDLHGRLKSNVDSVSSLNNQVIIRKPFEIQILRDLFVFVQLIFACDQQSRTVPQGYKDVELPIFQLSELQRENVRLRAELEREVTERQTLQLQMESKDNLLSSFRSQVDPKIGTYGPQYLPPGTTTSELLYRTPGKDRYGKVR